MNTLKTKKAIQSAQVLCAKPLYALLISWHELVVGYFSFLAFVLGYVWPHVYAFMHMCNESVCSYAFWLADTIALAVMCWALLNWFVEQNNQRMHRGKGAKLEGWFTGVLIWCFINTTQPPRFLHLPPSPLLYFKLNKCLFTHPRGLKMTGLCVGVDL